MPPLLQRQSPPAGSQHGRILVRAIVQGAAHGIDVAFPGRDAEPRLRTRHDGRNLRSDMKLAIAIAVMLAKCQPCSWATLGEFVVFLRLGERVGVDVLVRRCGADPGVPLITLEAAASPLWWSLSGREKRDTANAYRGHRAQTETFPPPFSFGH